MKSKRAHKSTRKKTTIWKDWKICACRTYFGSCGGPDWPTKRISAANPRALAYSSRPDTALLFRWLMRSPTPASWAARSSSAVRGGREGHAAPEELPSSPSLEGPRGSRGWKEDILERRLLLKIWNGAFQPLFSFQLITLLSCSFPSAISSLTASSAASWRAAFLLGADDSANKFSPTFTLYLNLRRWKRDFFLVWSVTDRFIDEQKNKAWCTRGQDMLLFW